MNNEIKIKILINYFLRQRQICNEKAEFFVNKNAVPEKNYFIVDTVLQLIIQ